MLKTLQQKKTGVRILMGVILVFISGAMVITLVPGLGGSMTASPDAVARVGNEEITRVDVENMLNRQMHGQAVPPIMRGLYAKQVLNGMISIKLLDAEAKRLGLTVTPEEERDRIKRYLPEAFVGDAWVGKDQYAAVVQRTGMTVEEFEEFVRQQLLEEKFRSLLTDGISVSPSEVAQEFRRRNEKVAIEYALLKPTDLAGAINPTDAELSGYFGKNQSRYQVAERRSANYALLDLNQLRARTAESDDELRAYYKQHIDDYKVENRVHAEHILFKTVGKTDAEVAEIRQKAEDILTKAKSGANFEDLAKKNSEDDATKPKGGDLGWIAQKQTVAEFEHAAFTLPKGAISDLVKTQYGFHIIKVLDKETAHTKSFEEVKATIEPLLLEQKVTAQANAISDQMAAAVRQSNRQPLEPLGKKFNLAVGTTPAASLTEPMGELGNGPDVHQILFALRQGDLSQPLRTDRGFVILTLKEIAPAHQGTLAEVRDRVLADYRRDTSADLARTRAQELAKRVHGGEALGKAAKTMGIEVKTSDAFTRDGQVGDLGAASQFEAAFSMPVDKTSEATPLAANWVVYRVASHDQPQPAALILQQKDIEQKVLQSKQSAAFEAFRAELEARMKKEGKLAIDPANLKALTGPGQL